MPPIGPDVHSVLDTFPEPARTMFFDLRRLIFKTARETEGVGTVVETLKWSQPAYLTVAPKSGTTIRLGLTSGRDANLALFVHCGTTLVSDYRALYDNVFTFDGKRALLLPREGNLPEEALSHCIAMALTYHLKR